MNVTGESKYIRCELVYISDQNTVGVLYRTDSGYGVAAPMMETKDRGTEKKKYGREKHNLGLLLLLLLPRMPKACGGPVRDPKVAAREVAGEEEDWVEPERKTLGERLGIPLLLLGSPKGRAKRVE